MVVEKKVEFEIDHRFDPVKNRHYLNGFCSVLHCHHYATLYTQLADDAVDFEDTIGTFNFGVAYKFQEYSRCFGTYFSCLFFHDKNTGGFPRAVIYL